MSRTRAVFFDAGHTLLYAHPDLGTVYAETTAALGPRIEPRRFIEAFQPVFRESVREYQSQGAASDAQDYAMWRDITRRIYDRISELHAIEFADWFEALYRRFGEPEVWRLYDDVVPVLGELRREGLVLGVVSNWDTRLRSICAGIGLDRLVDFIVISAEVGVRKPDPRIFHVALEQAKVEPAEAVHVGDLPAEDGEGAKRAGVRPLIVDRQKRLAASEPMPGVPVIRSLEELSDRL